MSSLIYSMSVSVDGFIADRDGSLGFTGPPGAEQCVAHQRSCSGQESATSRSAVSDKCCATAEGL